MTIADEALRSIAKLERSVTKRDAGVNYADYVNLAFFFAIYSALKREDLDHVRYR